MRDNDRVSIYRDDGIVLRTQKLGEADRIVTLLARRTGRIRAVAKGVRRTKSRFGARLEPFTHVDLLLYTGRSLDVITQAETLRPYGEPLVGDYPRYTAGTAMLETAERLTPVEKEPALRQFLLLVGGLRALGEGGTTRGWCSTPTCCARWPSPAYAPALDECAVCGTRVAGRPRHLPGGAARVRVRDRGRRPGLPVLPGAGRGHAGRRRRSSLMSALLRGDWAQADASERRHQAECSGLVAAYLQWHLEHSIRSLRHVEHA